MSPNRRDRPKLGIWHQLYLKLIVTDAKIEVRFGWHDYGTSPDCAQRCREITVVSAIGTNVGVLPRPEHRQQVVGIVPPEVPFQETYRIFHRSQPHLAVLPLAKEILRERPPRVHAAEGPQ